MQNSNKHPKMMLVCGCNGAGKSTLTYSTLKKENFYLYVDPDRIAKEEKKSPIEAGKEAVKRTQKNLDKKISFIKESTLSSHSDLKLIQKAKEQGFYVKMHYVGLSKVTDAIARVQDRSQNGGHSVPVEDIQRRYDRSIANLPKAIALADEITIYDNSKNDYQHVATYEKGQLVNKEFAPHWFEKVENAYKEQTEKLYHEKKLVYHQAKEQGLVNSFAKDTSKDFNSKYPHLKPFGNAIKELENKLDKSNADDDTKFAVNKVNREKLLNEFIDKTAEQNLNRKNNELQKDNQPQKNLQTQQQMQSQTLQEQKITTAHDDIEH